MSGAWPGLSGAARADNSGTIGNRRADQHANRKRSAATVEPVKKGMKSRVVRGTQELYRHQLSTKNRHSSKRAPVAPTSLVRTTSATHTTLPGVSDPIAIGVAMISSTLAPG